jgi:two-component system chemotaxis sensor kinase CheA
MVPVKATFQKMARLARDLSRKYNKPVEFIVKGEETELDKSVVDHIGDPLVHMIRNAIDHGLEANVADRENLGKPPVGRIELRAYHKGGSIYIEIEDDGKGLDKDAILKKAIERGLAKSDDQLSDKDIYNLIFEPGFSTAKKVTDVSGRGVGMDVVRKNIERLRGQVEIKSEPGKGSLFTLRLPLTLAIIDGMVVNVGNERYIIPTLSVVRSINPDKEALSTVMGRGELLQVQGELIPLFRLNRLFGIPGAVEDPTQAIAVVVESDNMQTGLMVDELVGQQQIVIKSLGESLQKVQGLSGGAIMPDGMVGLILDIGGLVKLANAGEIDYDQFKDIVPEEVDLEADKHEKEDT